jgi:Rrf2 family protein
MKQIADERLLPPSFVRRIVARLAGAGILKTVRGMGGGVGLARPASEISLLDLVRVMEGGIVLNRCVSDPPQCPLSETCPVQLAWTGATRTVENYLDATRFDRLAGK